MRRRRIRVALVGVGVGMIVVPTLLVLPLRWLAPPTTAFMVGHWMRAEAPQYQWTAWEGIAPEAALAVIAAEDQTFLDHAGFDVDSIQDAWAEARRGGRRRGASTISQQVAKNLFLWSGGGFFRKGIEAYLTLYIETWWPKQRILEVYLNVAEFGHGIYGITAASDHYFGVTPAAITAPQTALLAAVLPSPKRLRVDEPSDYVRERQAWIRGQMAQFGGPAFLEPLYTR